MLTAPCAALAEGDVPVVYTFLQNLVAKSNVYVLSVIENCPVFPVAPPNKHTLF